MVVLLAGWGQDAKEIAYLGIDKCPHCRNYDHFHLYEVTKKITAFFVPIAKWGQRYYAVCSTCEHCHELDEATKDDLLRKAAMLPDIDDFTEMWNQMEIGVREALSTDGDIEAALTNGLIQLREAYGQQHADHVCGIYAECLADTDQAGVED